MTDKKKSPRMAAGGFGEGVATFDENHDADRATIFYKCKDEKHAEARRLLGKGYKLCKLLPMSKQPDGDAWNKHLVTEIDPTAGGYGLLLAANGLCSIDPDNVEPAREGFSCCGFDLEELMESGVRTSSTRPGSGGRSTFRVPAGYAGRLTWIKFSSKSAGTILELRATSPNLQDSLPGTIYNAKDGSGPYTQQYASDKRLEEAPDLPQHLREWWARMSEDIDYQQEQQRLFCGPGAHLSVSIGNKLGFRSAFSHEFNKSHDVVEILLRHDYTESKRGRFAPPTASGAPSVREIPGKDGLWQSDHASDPLTGTFDAWTAFVVLDHDGDLSAAEEAYSVERKDSLPAGFQDVPTLPNDPPPLPSFDRTDSGAVKASKTNLVLAMRRRDVCGKHIRFDTFRGEVMLAESGTEEWRSFKESDYMELCLRLEGGGFQSIQKDVFRDVVSYVAEHSTFDSAQHWLNSLHWDGQHRISDFLARYFGAENTQYTRAVSQYLWTALAGRVLSPGVKADMVPIAVGVQGARKSSSVAALSPAPEFFGALDLSAKDDEQARLMRAKLVLELAELRGLRTREAEHIKAFVARSHEEWVPKYKELPVRYPRRCIFFGTSNKDDFLSDETGNRRWLPFRCGTCDPDAIERDREQLWAEARELFKTNGVMYREAEQLAETEHESFTEQDEWEPVVWKWLQTPDPITSEIPFARAFITSSEVLRCAVGLDNSRQSAAVSARIKKVLLRIGYAPGTARISGVRTRVFTPPSLF